MSQNDAWAPDPTGRNELRWWDGFRWTDHVANAGVTDHDPLTPPSTFAGQAQGQVRDPRASWVSFPDAITRCFAGYAEFSGRASRSEYWWWTLFGGIVYTLTVIVMVVIVGAGGNEAVLLLVGVVWLGLVLPSLAVGVRRLHDVGQPGWWLLIGLVPFGGIVLLVFYVMETQPYVNAFGPPPSYPTSPTS